jgi:cob(I)alamin adenosyltransferase
MLPPTEALIPSRQQLEVVQHAMFDLGAAIATPLSKANGRKLEKTRFDDSSTAVLEMWIDRMEETLPKLHTFILPGGHPAGASLHLARSLCRRAERCVLPLQQGGEVAPEVLTYLNRLSDYLFVASRYVNHALAMPETAWQPHRSSATE